jgi:hypothetical protein
MSSTYLLTSRAVGAAVGAAMVPPMRREAIMVINMVLSLKVILISFLGEGWIN